MTAATVMSDEVPVLDVTDLVADHGVELPLVEPLQQAAGDPHPGVGPVVAEGEGVGHAVVDDAELDEGYPGVPAAAGHDFADRVFGPVAGAVVVDDAGRHHPLDDPRVDGVLEQDQADGEEGRKPQRRPGEDHEQEPDRNRQTDQADDRRQMTAVARSP